jgi:hypothetical protein
MKLEPKNNCPLNNFDPCKELECAWFMRIAGANARTGEMMDSWGCAIPWVPILLVENTQQQKSTASNASSFVSQHQEFLRNAELQSEAEQCRLNVHQRAQENRGRGTILSYGPVQKEFKKWCHSKKFSNNETVNAAKLLTFLVNEVVDRASRKGATGK